MFKEVPLLGETFFKRKMLNETKHDEKKMTIPTFSEYGNNIAM